MDNSPLARLPSELRNRVYELALTVQMDYPIYLRDIDLHIGLTRTCRQARNESRPMFYAFNRFEISLVDQQRATKLCRFLRLLSADTVCSIGCLSLIQSAGLAGAKGGIAILGRGCRGLLPSALGDEQAPRREHWWDLARQVLAVHEEMG